MNSLEIKLSLSLVENVTSAIIEKLYNLAITSKVLDLSNSFSMSLSGSIYANSAYESSVLYLREKFSPNLIITVRDNNFYIKFVDSNVENILVQSLYCTDHVGFSLNDATLMTNIPATLFKENTNISTFNELNKFGSISLDNSAFYNCTNLTSINLSTVTSIGLLAFKGCTSLAQVISIPNLTSLGKETFMNSGITQVTNLGSTISNIPDSCFRNCSALTSFTVPSSVIALEIESFRSCSNLTTFDFSNILSIGRSCFLLSGLSGTLNIPNLSGTLRASTFLETNITNITNLGSITSISEDAGLIEGTFLKCSALTSVVIPPTVTRIGTSAFANCNNLTLITCTWENIIELGSNSFDITPGWEFVVNFANLTTLGSTNPFGKTRGYRRIKLLYIPKITNTSVSGYYSNSTYYRGLFTGINCDIIYFRDIEDFHPGDFGYCTCANLVINNVTPPVWKNTNDVEDSEVTDNANRKSRVINDGTSSITKIYVPDSAVTTYKNDSNWSSVSSKINPLSELSKVATEADLLNEIALIEAYM